MQIPARLADVIAQYLVSGKDDGTGIWLVIVLVVSPLAVGLALRWYDRRNSGGADDVNASDAATERRTYGYGGYATRVLASLVAIGICVLIATALGFSSWVGVVAGIAVAAIVSEFENSRFRGEFPRD